MTFVRRSAQAATPTTTQPTAGQRNVLLAICLVVVVLIALALAGVVDHTWWQVVLLGIVEGLTEFLPISSTAHLLIVADLLGFENSLNGTFEIFIQFGAVLAVVLFYLDNLVDQARAVPHNPAARRFWLAIVIAVIPAALIGMLLHKWIKFVLFESPLVIALSLIIGGVVLIVVERLPRFTAVEHHVEHISLRRALAIGCAQLFALIPGVSRSGASIVGGMAAGLDRRTATAFSFYLAIPTLGGATLVEFVSGLQQFSTGDIARLLLGALVSLVVAWLSIGWLLRYVASNSFVRFGYYRIAAGLVIIALMLLGQL